MKKKAKNPNVVVGSNKRPILSFLKKSKQVVGYSPEKAAETSAKASANTDAAKTLFPEPDKPRKPGTLISEGELAPHKDYRKRNQIIAGAAVLLIVAGMVFVFLTKFYKSTATKVNQEITTANQYVRERDRSQALAHARKALSYAPDDPDAILAVAALTEDPNEAKQLYAHALEVFKIQDNPDESGKKAVTYWAAAGLAEKAGYTDQAKQYYQKVIDAASPSNSYEQNLAKQSKAALKRLQ